MILDADFIVGAVQLYDRCGGHSKIADFSKASDSVFPYLPEAADNGRTDRSLLVPHSLRGDIERRRTFEGKLVQKLLPVVAYYRE